MIMVELENFLAFGNSINNQFNEIFVEDEDVLERQTQIYVQLFRSSRVITKEQILEWDDVEYFLGILGKYDGDESDLDGVEFYETCTYKGEGEGFVVKNAETEKLPVFVSKNRNML